MSQYVKFALQTILLISIIICLHVTFFKSDRKLYLKTYFYVKLNIRKYNVFGAFTSTNEATLIELSKFVVIE